MLHQGIVNALEKKIDDQVKLDLDENYMMI